MKVIAAISMLLCLVTSPGFANEGDFSQFKLDLMLAKRGDPGAQFYVAIAYEEGRGVARNMQKAVEWYAKAAKKHHNGAQYKLGQLYEQGIGVKKNLAMAKKWYEVAAANGSRLAKRRLQQLAAGQSATQARLQAQAKARQQEKARQRERALEKARQQQAKQKQQRLAAEKARQQQLAQQRKAAAVVNKPKPVSKPKLLNIPNLLELVLNSQWKRQQQAAGLLPSAVNSCLQAGNEVVCFSKEQHRVVGNSQLTFTSKSRITGFTKNSFTVHYLFNVLEKSAAASRGPANDPLGLRLQEGWQEPELSMHCQAVSRTQLRCRHAGQSFSYYR